MPSTTIYEFGDVVLVNYYHTDGSRTEKRPAVVVSCDVHNRDDVDVVLMAVTSKSHQEERHGALDLPDWRQAGLLKESVAKPVFTTTAKDSILHKFGRLGPTTRKKLLQEVAKVFGFKRASSPI